MPMPHMKTLLNFKNLISSQTINYFFLRPPKDFTTVQCTVKAVKQCIPTRCTTTISYSSHIMLCNTLTAEYLRDPIVRKYYADNHKRP